MCSERRKQSKIIGVVIKGQRAVAPGGALRGPRGYIEHIHPHACGLKFTTWWKHCRKSVICSINRETGGAQTCLAIVLSLKHWPSQAKLAPFSLQTTSLCPFFLHQSINTVWRYVSLSLLQQHKALSVHSKLTQARSKCSKTSWIDNKDTRQFSNVINHEWSGGVA